MTKIRSNKAGARCPHREHLIQLWRETRLTARPFTETESGSRSRSHR
jgi:Zn ribbon nucleic-acid-binding protein